MTQRRGPLAHERTASEMDRRLTIMEQQQLNYSRRLDEHMVATARLIDILDKRQDRSDIHQARLIGGLLVAQFLVILFAPVIRSALGLN